MVRVVGVRFKKAGKVYYFDPADHQIAMGARVVVETARGVEYGEVAVGLKDVEEDQVVQPLKKVLRPGTDKDAVVATENKRKEKEAFTLAQKKIEDHTLEMTLVDVEYTFDGSKIIFYFTAEGRIDFRDLVRDLASVFRTRIEMRQIGVRDEAKLLGGIGPCGRILCCTSFLGDFAPVSIRMAKDQNLSLNPSKISGLCGRLMCCLRYEQETYEAAKKDPTLAPGYVPPSVPTEAEELADIEERPTPIIGIRSGRDTAGMGARIARAVEDLEKQQPRERQAPERRQGGGERPQPRPQGQKPGNPQVQGQGQPGRPSVGGPLRREHQGDRSALSLGPERRDQQPKGKQHVSAKGQGPERQQIAKGKGGKPRPQQGVPQGQQQAAPRPGNQGGPQGGKPQGAKPPQIQTQNDQQRTERPEGSKSRSRRHRRRKGGDKPQGGEKPQGGQPS